VNPSNDDIEIILAELQRGKQVRVGGSRSHYYYGYKEGAWFTGAFDEGDRQEYSSTRDKMIQIIKGNYSSFQPLLQLPHERILADALHSGDVPLVLKHLELWTDVGGNLENSQVLQAFVQWPEVMPSDEVKRVIREKIGGFTAYHVLMGPLQFKQTVENGLLGLKYLEVLLDIVGECPGWRRLRATFRQMSGDIVGTIADLEVYLENLSEEQKYEEDSLKMRIEGLKKRLQ